MASASATSMVPGGTAVPDVDDHLTARPAEPSSMLRYPTYLEETHFSEARAACWAKLREADQLQMENDISAMADEHVVALMERTRELQQAAMDLDPTCVDASVRFQALTKMTRPELTDAYRECVEGEQRRLGGDAFFAEHSGSDLWAAVQTRPYVRALANLVLSLLDDGRPAAKAEAKGWIIKLTAADHKDVLRLQGRLVKLLLDEGAGDEALAAIMRRTGGRDLDMATSFDAALATTYAHGPFATASGAAPDAKAEAGAGAGALDNSPAQAGADAETDDPAHSERTAPTAAPAAATGELSTDDLRRRAEFWLRRAVRLNPFVPAMLCGKRGAPIAAKVTPTADVELGSKAEAWQYVEPMRRAWGAADGAVAWLVAVTGPLCLLGCSCSGCAVRESKLGQFQVCGKCKDAAYCSKECQTRHWPAHKSECKRLSAEASKQRPAGGALEMALGMLPGVDAGARARPGGFMLGAPE